MVMFNVIRNTVGIWLGGPVSMQGNGNGDGDGIGNSNGTFNGNGNGQCNGQCNGNHATQFWLGGPVSMQGSFFDLLTHNAALERVYFATTSLLMAAMMMITLSLKMMMDMSQWATQNFLASNPSVDHP